MNYERHILPNDGKRLVETMPLRDQLADILRQMIMKGELKAGDQINERQLSLRFQISTTPIKEALRILQAEGLVYSKARVGTFVEEISPASIYEIVAMRGALEGVAAHFAAQYCTQEEIDQMTKLLDEVELCLEQELRSEDIATLNTQFHRILRGCSRNNYLVNLICNMNSIDKTIRTLSFEIRNAHREAKVAYSEHRAILEAVANHEPKRAETLMNQHIRRVAKEVTKLK